MIMIMFGILFLSLIVSLNKELLLLLILVILKKLNSWNGLVMLNINLYN